MLNLFVSIIVLGMIAFILFLVQNQDKESPNKRMPSGNYGSHGRLYPGTIILKNRSQLKFF